MTNIVTFALFRNEQISSRMIIHKSKQIQSMGDNSVETYWCKASFQVKLAKNDLYDILGLCLVKYTYFLSNLIFMHMFPALKNSQSS